MVSVLEMVVKDNFEFKARICKDIAIIPVNIGKICILRLDTILVPTLVEFAYLIKYAIFIPSYSLYKVISCDNMIFLSGYRK